jgi:hypothetical protein
MNQKFNKNEIIVYFNNNLKKWILGKIISNKNSNKYEILLTDKSIKEVTTDEIRYMNTAGLLRCFWTYDNYKYWICNFHVPLHQVPKDIKIAFSYINKYKLDYI